jgi:hypothetical protein
MNRKLSDEQITTTFEALRTAGQNISVRAVRAALRERFGAAGKSERVFALCRALRQPAVREPELIEHLRCALLQAEQSRTVAQQERDQALDRAQRSEARELAHQDRWANEIHLLRENVVQLKGERTRRQVLEETVLRLQRELQELQLRLAQANG